MSDQIAEGFSNYSSITELIVTHDVCITPANCYTREYLALDIGPKLYDIELMVSFSLVGFNHFYHFFFYNICH